MAGVLNGVRPGDQLAEIANRAGGFEPALRIWVVEAVRATTCRAGHRSDRARCRPSSMSCWPITSGVGHGSN